MPVARLWAGYGSQYASDIALALGALFIIQSSLWGLGRYLQKGVVVPSVIALFSLGVVLGIVRVQMEHEPQALTCERACTIEAYVARSPEQKDSYQELVLEVDNEHARVLVRAPLYPEYQIGDMLSVTGVIRTPQVIMSHGDKQFFDYPAYLQTRSIGSESLYPKITVVDEEAHTFTHLLGRLKEDMVARVDGAIDAPASSLASGMLFGNASMSKELTETFRVAGLSHIVVLSGFNIAIIISFVLLLLRVAPAVCLKYWCSTLDISPQQFYKPVISKSQSRGTYRRKAQYGVITIYFNNTKLRDILTGEIEKLRRK
jgi:hypothetical protein